MAEVRDASGAVVGGLPVPSPDEALIRAQNARRLARRRQAAALAERVGRVSGEDLSRFGDTRVVGGTFETLQEVPERETPSRFGLSIEDIAAFLQAFNFEARDQILGSSSFLSSFGPGILGFNTTGAD
jgi:hypothetical protein